jgi:TM2 domain-containing membrane protein YozV
MEENMFCPNCGKQNPDNAKFCAVCGAPINTAGPQYAAPPPPQYAPPPQYSAPPAQQTIINMAPPQAPPVMPFATGISPKSKTAAAILAFFLGSLGIHRFYVGKIGTGIIILILTIIGAATYTFIVGGFVLGVVGLWVLIDFIMILMGKFKDKHGLYLKN